jgi:hypothetical protein
LWDGIRSFFEKMFSHKLVVVYLDGTTEIMGHYKTLIEAVDNGKIITRNYSDYSLAIYILCKNMRKVYLYENKLQRIETSEKNWDSLFQEFEISSAPSTSLGMLDIQHDVEERMKSGFKGATTRKKKSQGLFWGSPQPKREKSRSVSSSFHRSTSKNTFSGTDFLNAGLPPKRKRFW